ncbi:MAG: hypothetical protein M3437_02460 [Chloroflexota bacterium]|nr:hypothetical protein [Chloroflexota bacterium]MDQ5865698.1 hypothetical protein [Chloroflexota bacterium]
MAEEEHDEENSEGTSVLSKKIPNQDLYRLAVVGKDEVNEPTSVLIEVNLPPREISYGPREDMKSGDRFSFSRPIEIVQESPAQEEENKRRVREATKFLTKVLGKKPHYIPVGRAFVATVRPDQLALIARSPLIKAIQPNRKLR